MPYWCFNREYIRGPKKEIQDLTQKLENWTRKNYEENGFGTGWLGNIVGFAGLKRIDEIPEKEGGLHCRGNLVELEPNKFFETTYENDTGEIKFESETAWEPVPELWYAVLKKHAPHCKYYYQSQENQMGILESNDVEHIYFDEEFYVENIYEHPKKVNENVKKHFPESMGFDYSFDTAEITEALQEILETKETDVKTLLNEYEKNRDKLMGDKENHLSILQYEYKNN